MVDPNFQIGGGGAVTQSMRLGGRGGVVSKKFFFQFGLKIRWRGEVGGPPEPLPWVCHLVGGKKSTLYNQWIWLLDLLNNLCTHNVRNAIVLVDCAKPVFTSCTR